MKLKKCPLLWLDLEYKASHAPVAKFLLHFLNQHHRKEEGMEDDDQLKKNKKEIHVIFYFSIVSTPENGALIGPTQATFNSYCTKTPKPNGT